MDNRDFKKKQIWQSREAVRRRVRARKRKRIIAILSIVAVLVLIVGGVIFTVRTLQNNAIETAQNAESASEALPVEEQVTQPDPEPIVTKVSFSASGDNLIHDGLYNQAKRRSADGTYDFTYLYENIAPFFSNYDINFINQETLISNEIAPDNYPCFCTPGEMGMALYNIGFRVFSLCNNHTYDKGAEGLASTIRFWESMPSDVVYFGIHENGTDYTNIALQTVNDITFAYLAYTEHTNGINTPQSGNYHVVYTSQTDIIEQQIRYASTIADVVIPVVHWGTENSHVVNDAQRTLAQNMVDWGASVILGSHPHVIQDIEVLTSAETGKTAPVFYCLGNFVSMQAQRDNLIAIVATFNVEKTVYPNGEKTVEIKDIEAHPLIMHYDSGWANARAYWVKDYTSQLAAAHGNGSMSLEYINSVIQANVKEEYLVME